MEYITQNKTQWSQYDIVYTYMYNCILFINCVESDQLFSQVLERDNTCRKLYTINLNHRQGSYSDLYAIKRLSFSQNQNLLCNVQTSLMTAIIKCVAVHGKWYSDKSNSELLKQVISWMVRTLLMYGFWCGFGCYHEVVQYSYNRFTHILRDYFTSTEVIFFWLLNTSEATLTNMNKNNLCI